MATTCPDTKIVLGGYSQGAAVVDIITVADQPTLGFAQPMPANVADHVAAVAVFGNPSIRLLGGPLNAVSPLYGYKTLDLCNGADPVCSNGDDVAAHSLYVNLDWQRRQRSSSPTGSPPRRRSARWPARARDEHRLTPGVHGVLCRLKALYHKQFGGVGRLLADRGNLAPFGGGEVAQHKRRTFHAAGRATDSDAHPLEVVRAQRRSH